MSFSLNSPRCLITDHDCARFIENLKKVDEIIMLSDYPASDQNFLPRQSGSSDVRGG